MKRQQKGFTIVELIIVIATIAVLASVLIPTFSNLIKQSQEAKDTALISDLNKGLAMSGTKFDTMHDALTAVDENIGIDVTKINAAATKNEILFDSENQCFVYLKEGETKPTILLILKKRKLGQTSNTSIGKLLNSLFLKISILSTLQEQAMLMTLLFPPVLMSVVTPVLKMSSMKIRQVIARTLLFVPIVLKLPLP